MCLNILREDWKPVLNLNSVMVGLQYLFLEPNADDPLNKGASFLQLLKLALTRMVIACRGCNRDEQEPGPILGQREIIYEGTEHQGSSIRQRPRSMTVLSRRFMASFLLVLHLTLRAYLLPSFPVA